MLRQSFTDFIFATNTDGSGKAASYVRALDMLGPILTKHYQIVRKRESYETPTAECIFRKKRKDQVERDAAWSMCVGGFIATTRRRHQIQMEVNKEAF